MSVAVVSEINRRLRSYGITVHEAPGWQGRSNGQTSSYVGGLIHHTASGYDVALPGKGIYNLLINGRGEPNPLKGPLANYAGNSDGSFTVLSAGPANHAGSSGGKSMGPLPVTTSFNRKVLGLEIVYPGDQVMTTKQYDAALVWARVVADVVGGGNIESVRAHAETSVTGKWDPGYAPGKTIDMTAFRAAAAAPIGGDEVKNLILAQAPDGKVYVGDGIHRRHVKDPVELSGLQFWIKQRGGDDTVHKPFNDLRVLGRDTDTETEHLVALAYRVKAFLDGLETVPNSAYPESIRGESVQVSQTLNELKADVQEILDKLNESA
jgi:hypothetical protein